MDEKMGSPRQIFCGQKLDFCHLQFFFFSNLVWSGTRVPFSHQPKIAQPQLKPFSDALFTMVKQLRVAQTLGKFIAEMGQASQ